MPRPRLSAEMKWLRGTLEPARERQRLAAEAQLDRVQRKPSWDDPWSILSLDVDPATIPRPDEPKPPSRKPRR